MKRPPFSSEYACLLHADIDQIFHELGGTRLPSQHLFCHVVQKHGRPWTGVMPDRSAICLFARVLRVNFGIRPRVLRFGNDQRRGYRRQDFNRRTRAVD